METYRKINQWTSHSRDMVESFKRYYNNSFLDKQRQEAYNLFLGNYIFVQGQPMLWDLSTDYYLHHTDPRSWFGQRRKNYIQWFTPEHLDGPTMPQDAKSCHLAGKPLGFFDEYWFEYYRPLALSSFQKMFSYKMNSTLRYIPFKSTKEGKYDLSPFRVRDGHDHASPDKGQQSKGAMVVDSEKKTAEEQNISPIHNVPQSKRALPAWLQSQVGEQPLPQHSILKNPPAEGIHGSSLIDATKEKKAFKDKMAVTQWTLDQFVTNSLNPSVADTEAHEYQRYISHPLNLPLVITTDMPPNPNLEFLGYVNSVSADAVNNMHSTEDDLADHEDFLDIGEDPLTVTEADTAKKRYKAYRQWVKGKSLFKQRVDV